MGLVNRISSFDDLDDYVQGYTDDDRECAVVVAGHQLDRQRVGEGQGRSRYGALREGGRGLRRSSDLEEGRRAFMEKRDPVTGR